MLKLVFSVAGPGKRSFTSFRMTREGSVTSEGLEDRGCALKGKKWPFFGFHWPQIHQIWAKLPVKGKNEAVFAFHFVQDVP